MKHHSHAARSVPGMSHGHRPGARPAVDHAKALDDYRQGRLAEAAATMGAVALATPTNATVWSDFGVIRAASGEIALALECYERALAIQPNHAGALGNKGMALSALGRHEEALVCYDRALAFHPRSAEHNNNKGGALRALGRFEAALQSFDAALAIRADFVDALNNRANTLADLGRHAKALETFERLRKLAPGRFDVCINQGVALLRTGQAEAALVSLDEAVRLAPNSPQAHDSRGEALRRLGRPAEAAQAFFRALALNPKFAEAFFHLGQTFLDLKLLTEAIAAMRTALQLNRGLAPALRNLWQVQMNLHQFAEAAATSELAIAYDPRDVDSRNLRGIALSHLGRDEEALADYDAAIAVDPSSVIALNNKALLLIQLGRIEAGLAQLNEAVARAPQNAHAYYNLSRFRTFTPEDPIFAALAPVRDGQLPADPNEVAAAGFALGKAYADIGEFDASFESLARAHAALREISPYDEQATLDILRRTGAAARRKDFANRVGGDPSPVPVFIVGMPRSGTSLLEQILAGVPGVHGAGEIYDLEFAIRDIGGAMAESFDRPEAVAEVSSADWTRLGADYVRRIRALAPDARRIVNKTPENFRLLGLIARAMPNAKILHIHRDPRDTCVSCFSLRFLDSRAHAHDLGELGRYYRAYDSLMEQFRAALPEGMMIDVRYEDLVANIESESRAVVAHCGLAWDPACLDFHKRERIVRTASLAQVRKPLFSSSIGRWRAYEKHLGPLLEALQLPADA